MKETDNNELFAPETECEAAPKTTAAATKPAASASPSAESEDESAPASKKRVRRSNAQIAADKQAEEDAVRQRIREEYFQELCEKNLVKTDPVTGELLSDNANLDIYNRLRGVPAKAKSSIDDGPLGGKGLSSINGMWRIKQMTETFGVCGVGWKIVPVSEKLTSFGGASTVQILVHVFIRTEEGWSEPIPGFGGAQYMKGVFADDEAYKKAFTDALGNACKLLGLGADVYYEADVDPDSKYAPGYKAPVTNPDNHATTETIAFPAAESPGRPAVAATPSVTAPAPVKAAPAPTASAPAPEEPKPTMPLPPHISAPEKSETPVETAPAPEATAAKIATRMGLSGGPKPLVKNSANWNRIITDLSCLTVTTKEKLNSVRIAYSQIFVISDEQWDELLETAGII